MKKSFIVILCLLLCFSSVLIASASSGGSGSEGEQEPSTASPTGEGLAGIAKDYFSKVQSGEALTGSIGELLRDSIIGDIINPNPSRPYTTKDYINILPESTYSPPTARTTAPTPYADTIPTTTEPTTAQVNIDDTYENKSYFEEPKTDVLSGSDENDIKWVQWYLISLNYKLTDDGITGVYDIYTDIAVRQFQADHSLAVNGVTDFATRVMMKRSYIELLATSTTEGTTLPNEGESTTVPAQTGTFTNVYKVLFIVIAVIVILCAAGVIAYVLIKNSSRDSSKYEENWLTKTLGDGQKIGSNPSERLNPSENSSAAVKEVQLEPEQPQGKSGSAHESGNGGEEPVSGADKKDYEDFYVENDE